MCQYMVILDIKVPDIGDFIEVTVTELMVKPLLRQIQAVFGKLPFGGRKAIKYNAAWLKGTSNAELKKT